MQLKDLKSLNVANKTVLVRVGFDVKVDEGKVRDDFRLKNALPTIRWLCDQDARVVLLSHRGRPRDEGEIWTKRFSMQPVALRLSELMERKLVEVEADTKKFPEYSVPHLYFFHQNVEQKNIKKLLEGMSAGDVAMLENLRFYEGEEKSSEDFAKILAELGDVYVNEAFSNSHRDHTSMTRLPAILPHAAGLGLAKEISALERVMTHPKTPLIMMLGGVKLATKAPVILNLARQADAVLLGGGLANLFLKVQGKPIGKSVCDRTQESVARQILRDFQEKIVLPTDVVVSESMDGKPSVVSTLQVKPHHLILDIGPETILNYSNYLKQGKTLVWNGPMGYFEQSAFSHGTSALANLFASRSGGTAFGVAGGGETMEALQHTGMEDYIDLLSTGGGAMLDFLSGKTFPALEELQK